MRRRMRKLRRLANQMPGYGIVSYIFCNMLIGFSIENADLRKSFLPKRGHEPEFSSGAKRESAFDELHRLLNGHVAVDG